MKSYATEFSYLGIDEMRQACGGAGFLLSSGIAYVWMELSPTVTFEGANALMAQQSARLIFKNADKVSRGKKPQRYFEYLAQLDELVSSRSTATTI